MDRKGLIGRLDMGFPSLVGVRGTVRAVRDLGVVTLILNVGLIG